MTFAKGETVNYTYIDYKTRGRKKGGKAIKKCITVQATYIGQVTDKTIELEFRTPVGKQKRKVPIKNVSGCA